tara:strand:+ start:316 stop:501 length:186 start_codon:yes stop_codon:yes gene_type:complete
MIIYRADTKKETMIKSLKGNKILTFYVKVDTVDKKEEKVPMNLKSFFNSLEQSVKGLPQIT